MTDKVIKCNSCGFPLDASSATQRRIKCPKCGVVNVIEPLKSAYPVNNGNFFGAVPVTADSAAIHKNLVYWICKNHETIPSDIFQALKLTSVEKLNVPCYLFECNASIRYSYQIGNTRERMRKVNNDIVSESYIEYTHQNDVYDFNECVIVSGNSEVSEHIQTLYSDLDIADLIDVNRLENPSDVNELSYDIQPLNALSEVKEIIGEASQSQIKELLKRNNYKDLQIRDNFRIDYGNEPKQIFLPLIHVSYEYKDKTGDVWFNGDAENVIPDEFPTSNQYKLSLERVEEQRPGCGSWLIAIISILVVILIPLGIYMIINMTNKSKEIDKELARLKKEHHKIFSQFIQKQMPLNGVLQKELMGKPEAFPERKELRNLGIRFYEST